MDFCKCAMVWPTLTSLLSFFFKLKSSLPNLKAIVQIIGKSSAEHPYVFDVS